MRAFKIFLLDLFTRHLGTKFLSLILSVVLFAFVLQSMSDEREISIHFEFTVDEELGPEFVVKTPTVDLHRIVVKGIRAKVEAVAQQFKRNRSVAIELSREIVGRSSELDARKQVLVPIDREFFRRLEILGREGGVELKGEIDPPQRIELERRGVVKLRLEVSPDYLRDLVLDPAGPYESGTGDASVRMRFQPETVMISGPVTSLPPENSALYVRVANVSEVLKRGERMLTAEGKPVKGKVESIDWSASHLGDPGFLAVGRYPGYPAVEILQRIDCEFDVKPRAATRDLAAIRIGFTFPSSFADGYLWGPAFLATYDGDGIGFTLGDADLRDGTCKRLTVKGPQTLLEDRDILGNLTLIIDLRIAEKNKDGTIEAPVYISITPDAKGSVPQAAIRQLVTIMTATEVKQPKVRFTPR